ncbi:MAG TPA: histidine phosphatase family protein [Polyangiales bacterium]
MTIVLVRHGQTASNFARILQVPETELDATGQQQARCLAPRLAALSPVHVLCSDLARARMTAAPLASLTGLPIELTPLLQERNFGDLRGKPYSAFSGGDPFVPDLIPPGGESWAAFHARVAEAFAAIVARRRACQGTLVVITHGLVLRSMFEFMIARGALTVPGSFDNTSVSIIAADAPHTATLINCVEHLAARPAEVGFA